MFYEMLETPGVSYTIRMKEYTRLRQMVEGEVQDLIISLSKNQEEFVEILSNIHQLQTKVCLLE